MARSIVDMLDAQGLGIDTSSGVGSGQTGFSGINFQEAIPNSNVQTKVKKINSRGPNSASNKKAFEKSIKKGAKTKDQILVDRVKTKSRETIAAKDNHIKMQKKGEELTILMDKFAGLNRQELMSKEGQALIKKHFPFAKDSKMLAATIERRGKLIKQLEALPLGSKYQKRKEQSCKKQASRSRNATCPLRLTSLG